MDIETIRGRVFFKLMSKDNKQFQNNEDDMVYQEIPNTDLVLTVRCLDFSEAKSFAVNHGFADQFGKPEAALLEMAQDFLNNQEYRFIPMANAISELTGSDINEDPHNSTELYVITNYQGVYGASLITRPDVRNMIREEIGYPFLVIPCSVHEVLVRRDTGEIDINDLRDMIIDINSSEVSSDDFLSNHVYRVGYDNQLRMIL